MSKNTCTSGLHTSQGKTDRKTSLVAVYGNWLNSEHWHYYCTFTTRYQLTLSAARKSMERLHSHLSFRFAFAPKIFWVAEPFDSKYGCHLHALIEVENKKLTSKTDIKNAWQVVSKGKGLKEYNNTTIKDYDRLKGGHFYLSKYLQRYNADYDIF
jgi:hypothetical protein